MKPLLTIFTPTYNRAYTIHKCYESLKKQSSKNFKWLIIDDGSTDNVKELVENWIKEENEFEISYIYQKNQGMHGAHNTAYKNIDTELNVCIDSDDYMEYDAVENINSFWKINGSDNVAGIVALDAYENREVIGSKFPNDLKKATLFDINQRYKIPGDKKIIYRTVLTNQFEYPLFEGERYVGLAYKYYKIDESYELMIMNEVVCIVEYMEDGSSKNMLNQYKTNPRGWCFYRLENLKIPNTSLKYKFKECIHYVSSSLICKNKSFIKDTSYKLMTLAAIPIGIMLYTYVIIKTKKK